MKDEAKVAVAVQPVFGALIRTLQACSLRDETVRSDIALLALGDVASSLAVGSGVLWGPDGAGLIEALRNLADELERQREREPALPLRTTLREFFATVPSPVMQ